MRLWHIDLIPVLPREQLIAQWRECSAIAGAILKNGSPNHLLVNFILDYSFDEFISYSYYVRQEMTKRGYKTMEKVWEKILSLKSDFCLIKKEDLFRCHMNGRYLTICYYNLGEKYLGGGISNTDMKKIEQLCIRFNDWSFTT